MENRIFKQIAGSIIRSWYEHQNPRCDAPENCETCPLTRHCDNLTTAANDSIRALRDINDNPMDEAAKERLNRAENLAMAQLQDFVFEMEVLCDRACHICPVQHYCNPIVGVVHNQELVEEAVTE